MTEADWQLFDARFADLSEQLRERDAKVEALEARVANLERWPSARTREAERFGERDVLRVVEPDPQPLCPPL